MSVGRCTHQLLANDLVHEMPGFLPHEFMDKQLDVRGLEPPLLQHTIPLAFGDVVATLGHVGDENGIDFAELLLRHSSLVCVHPGKQTRSFRVYCRRGPVCELRRHATYTCTWAHDAQKQEKFMRRTIVSVVHQVFEHLGLVQVSRRVLVELIEKLCYHPVMLVPQQARRRRLTYKP